MRLTVNPVFDFETLLRVSHSGQYDYHGYSQLLKGDSTDAAAEQSQASFDNTLQNIFSQQYATQSSTLNYLKNQMTPEINAGGVGASPTALAAARTSATDTISNQFQGALKAANASEDQSGLPSGVNAGIDSSLLSNEAQSQSAAQNSITASNEALRQSNYWNSINTLSGVAAQNNPLGYSAGATSGTGAVASASQAYTSSNQSQLLGALGGIVGGAANGLVSGGMSNLGKGVGFFG